ncbi:hypothetical protein [Scleromatobacter humisilvae]|uniref:Lipocalin-like domain-containing protein n=1 Tax=Scleromatobacter humisilvae TaxID=2897159 RepID=A0A9X1YF68_9BURK|nr:hypothetical protein [Scleromatobacter humisilvae]MCK9685259.1 hypothetical protein [Scleromatobacter humisilvae]
MPPPLFLRAASLLLLCALLHACSRHVPAAAPAPAPVAPPADVPSDMAGVWTSTRGPVMRCIELHADGTYLMAPNSEAGDHLNFHGTWRVADEQITWRDSSQGFAADVNRMVDVSPGHFTTIEADQSQTVFARIAGPGSTCPSQ